MANEWYTLQYTKQKQRPLPVELFGIEERDGVKCFSVWIGLIKGYIPFHETGLAREEEMFALLGSKYNALVTELDPAASLLKLSIRQAKERMAAETRDQLKPGLVRQATVQRLTRTRAILDIDGVDAVLPKDEISWAFTETPRDAIRLGQELRVKILEIHPDGVVIVSKKALEEDPWQRVAAQLVIGAPCMAEVTGTNEKGVFLKLQEGVSAMAPYPHTYNRPFTKGQRVVASVQMIKDNRRINCKIMRQID